MRQRYDFDGFSFAVGPDPADDRRLQVLVFRNGAPFNDLHGAQMQKGFAPSTGESRIEQFCRRFATDAAYRTQLLVKHAFACC